MEFVHRPEFQKAGNTFRKLDLLPSSGEGKEVPTLVGLIESVIEVSSFYGAQELTSITGPNRVGVSVPYPEEGSRSNFHNVVFYSYLEFQMVCKVHKINDSECYAPSSEHFRIYLNFRV
jgi:hypothetical protein